MEEQVRLPSADDLHVARLAVNKIGLCVKTPMLKDVQDIFGFKEISLFLKLENMQYGGSFKMRGISNQISMLPASVGTKERPLISLSAGNYGKSFAIATHKFGLVGVIIMPETAPINRAKLIESYGVKVERYPNSMLQKKVNEHIERNNMFLCHSFDDPNLIHGYSSLAHEILEDCPNPDIVLICCGGGGLLAGTAAGLKLLGNSKCRIYGIEPVGASTMYKSFHENHAVEMPDASSIASGLSPPYAGKVSYGYCKQLVDDIILVTDEELKKNMLKLYDHGLVVEPSGCAAFTALAEGKIPNTIGKTIVVIITGGNVTVEEMYEISKTK